MSTPSSIRYRYWLFQAMPALRSAWILTGVLLLMQIPHAFAQCDFLEPQLTYGACAGSGVGLYSYEDDVTYRLYMGGIMVASVAGNSSLSFGVHGEGTYIVTGQRAGCPEVQTGQSFTLSALPVNVQIVPDGALTRCQYLDLNVRYQTGENYQWYRNGSPIGGATSSYYQATATGSYTVVVSKAQCAKTADPLSVTIVSYPSTAVTASGNTTFCAGSSVTLNVQSPVGGNTYRWYNNGGNLVGTGTSYTATESGTYVMEASNGYCNAASSGIAVTRVSMPEASVSPSGTQAACSTCAVQLTTPAQPGYTYQWKRNGTSISGATSSNYTASQTGVFTVDVTHSICTIPSPNALDLRVNSAPIVNAGPDVTIRRPLNALTLQGAATDTDGAITAYRWTKVSGPQASLSESETAVVKLSGLAEGIYEFRLTATDNFGEQVSDQVTVTVAGLINYVRETVLQVATTQESTLAGLSVFDKTESTTFFDGLGRPIQNVARQGSPSLRDVIQPFTYDDLGRERRKYLPVTVNANNGGYKTGLIDALGNYSGMAANFYLNNYAAKIAQDTMPFAETIFDDSPLNRVTRQGAPGSVWQPKTNPANDHTIKKHYDLNSEDEVLLWIYNPPVSPDSLGAIEVSTNPGMTYYGANQLYKNVTLDEQKNAVVEYIDREGRTILKRVQAVADPTPAVNDVNYASTYYIYDDLGNLAGVLPPEAVKRITSGNEYFEKTPDEKAAFLRRWAFRYKYDQRQRMIIKQVPGAKPMYMVYDRRDRLVMTQDGNQRTLSPERTVAEWTFTKYDVMNRPVLTGTLASNTPWSALQNDVNNFYEALPAGAAAYETYMGVAAGNVMGYDNKSFPQVSAEGLYLTAIYYDAYDSFIAPSGYAYQSQGLQGEAQDKALPVTGQVTGTRVKNLATAAWMRTVNYYDDKHRVIQVVADHQKGTVRTSNTYDFAGKVALTQRNYVVDANTITVRERFAYDHAGRLLQTWHSVNNQPEVLLAENEYNELGQLVTRKLQGRSGGDAPVTADPAVGQPGVVYGQEITSSSYNSAQHTYIATRKVKLQQGFKVQATGPFKARLGFSQQDALAHNNALNTFRQIIDYRYNIRGWLTSINDPDAPQAEDLFNMSLRYNTPTSNGGTPQYNGNISEAIWKTDGLDRQSYGYSYDNMNRLLEAKYHNAAKPLYNGRYDEKIGGGSPAYDMNGNILNLVRKGKTGEQTYGLMDDLHYDYTDGNRLRYVADGAPVDANEEGFKEIAGGEGTLDYAYDANGNTTSDANKGITNIQYNYLNLPAKVSKSATEYIIYTYDATGGKLAQEVFGVEAKRTDYIGELVYESNMLQFINHAEGRVVMTGAAPEYQYHLKDHLGNVRVTFTTKSETEGSAATLEAAQAVAEQSKFLRYNNTRRVQSPLLDHTNGAATGHAERLNGSTNEKYGLARSLSVMPGDTVKMEVFAKYFDPNTANWTQALTNLASAITNNTGNIVVDGANYGISTTSFPYPGLVNTSLSTGTGPKAYLNWILFDRDYNFIDGGYVRMTTAAREYGQDIAHEKLSAEVPVTEPGYVYIYLSNENETFVEVFFDDLSVEHVNSPVVQMDDYYPFGLTFNSYRREHSAPQHHLYNGKELQDELGIAWLDYGARMYMPDLGRWTAMDPLSEKYYSHTSYNYVVNNPVITIDPDGMDSKRIQDLSGGWHTIDDGEYITVYQAGSADNGGDEGTKVKVAESRDESSWGPMERLGALLNPFEDLNRTLDVEEGGPGTMYFKIDSEGNIDLNKPQYYQYEANGLQFLRTLSQLRNARQLIRFVRDARFFRNTELRSFLSKYYRGNAQIGNGSSASALIYEAQTGQLISTTGHLGKVAGARNYFIQLLRSNTGLTEMERNFVIRQVVEANRAIRVTLQQGSNYAGRIDKDVMKIIRKYPY